MKVRQIKITRIRNSYENSYKKSGYGYNYHMKRCKVNG